MEALFAWHNLIFYVPLGFGLFLVAGVALGAADVPHGPDVDGGVDHDAGGDHHDGHDNESAKLLSILGFGKVPVMMIFMTMALTFGGTGVVCNMFLAPFLKLSSLFALFSVAGAFIGMLALTGTTARLVAKYLPTTETTSTTKSDLVGSTGTLILPTDDKSGLMQVTVGGDLYQVQCRSVTPLLKGQTVLVLSYDETSSLYAVEAYNQ